jgi:quinoprotein glucose dehydrogenase
MQLVAIAWAVLATIAVSGPAAAQPAIVTGPAPQRVADDYVAVPPGITVASVVGGLEIPWSLVFLPDGRWLVSERPGRIRVIDGGQLRAAPLATLEVVQRGEGGLMGLALHPRFPAEPFLYAMLTTPGRINRVVRLRVEGERAVMDRVIVDNIPAGTNHNGGRIAFGPDGMLYVGTGETFERALAQAPGGLNGKILRVTPDGGVPPDNPRPGSPVWTLGHRNVQGLAWDPRTGQLFASEHGPSGEGGLRAYDEINVIRPGANYGWGLMVGAPGRPGYADPLVAWPDVTTPPSGMAFWRGDLFVASLASQALLRIALAREGDGWQATRIERWFVPQRGARGTHGRLRDAVVGPDGALYLLTNNRDGRGAPRPGDDRILRLAPEG